MYCIHDILADAQKQLRPTPSHCGSLPCSLRRPLQDRQPWWPRHIPLLARPYPTMALLKLPSRRPLSLPRASIFRRIFLSWRLFLTTRPQSFPVVPITAPRPDPSVSNLASRDAKYLPVLVNVSRWHQVACRLPRVVIRAVPLPPCTIVMRGLGPVSVGDDGHLEEGWVVELVIVAKRRLNVRWRNHKTRLGNNTDWFGHRWQLAVFF